MENIFKNIEGFYPTPNELISKMFLKLDFKRIKTVLEPEAGKGDIVKAIIERNKTQYGWETHKINDIDCIEQNSYLSSILRDEGFRVVHNDFLTFDTYKEYDLIIMNPPFSDGDKHLLKAIKLQENGGQIICLLNAETLKNPYSNIRQQLVRKLYELDADIEYIQNGFVDAERPTGVEIAMVYINIPQKVYTSDLLDGLTKSYVCEDNSDLYQETSLIDSDILKALVQQYRYECYVGTNIIREFNALCPKMLDAAKDGHPVLSLQIGKSGATVNEYIKVIRKKYWTAFMRTEKITKMLTGNLQQEYMSKINDLVNYDFTLSNVYQICADMNKHMMDALEDTILSLFDELTRVHSWYPECENNIHYFDGWKTNKAWKINKKVILPMHTWDSIWGKFRFTQYDTLRKLNDMEKVFSYLETEDYIGPELTWALQCAEDRGQTKKIHCKYFDLTFYKKGTCHIQFTHEELLAKFNLYGCQKKGWLPPSYGKKNFNEMSEEEKQVIDSFEGETHYGMVMDRKDYYISELPQMLMIGA